MSGLRTLAGPDGKSPARNDPCPCGSGLKYKKCCAIRPRAGSPAQAAFGPLTAIGREAAAEEVAALANFSATPRPGSPPAPSPAVAGILGNARRLFEAGRAEAAIPLLEQAARLDPANAGILLDLGTVLLNGGRVREAADRLAHAVRLDPGMAIAHLHLGVALSRQGQIAAAIDAFRAAIACAPKLADAHMQLGELLRARLQTEPAAEALDKAAALLGNTTKGRLAAAEAALVRNRRDEAMTLLRRAMALDPKSAAVLRLLANALANAGRLDEAEEELTRALALDPAGVADYYTIATLRRMTQADRPMLERMATALRAGGVAERDRMLLHFGLGKAHDDLREFAAAASHFDAANRIRCAAAPLDRAALARFVDRHIELFPGGENGLDTTLGVDDERPVFILGLPRSGTTLVEQILSSHPGVAAGGELGFWGERDEALLAAGDDFFTRERLHALAAGYQDVLRGISADALRVTDKNPLNFFNIGLLRTAFPRAFIIHCRRHPVDTCLSMYTTILSAGDTLFMGNRDDLVFYHGEYSRMMRHWRAVLAPGRFMEIDYETLIADREVQTRRLVAFCELEWHDACLQPESNPRMIATASRWQARQPVYRSSVARWRNYRPWLGPLAGLLTEAERAE